MRGTCITTMIPCPPIVSPILSVPPEPAAAIPDTPSPMGLSMGTEILPFSTMPVPSIVFIARVPAKELAAAVDEKTTCICYFGGDPTPQVLHAIKTSRSALKRAQETERILRICWETNGAVQEPYLNMMAGLSLESGGCIKFDLKAWDEGLHYALCGVTNKQTLYNFRVLSEITRKRTVPPFLIASTLLVPGYIDEMEVGKIARYIADLNPEIPYSLLAFYPQFHLQDLPFTSRGHALRCKEAAEKMGLNNVHLGNVHLLRDGE